MLRHLCLSLARWGLLLSALAHAAALLGLGVPWPLVGGLHAGVFVLALLALGAARAVHPGHHTAWLRTGLLAGRPLGLQALVGALFVYAAINCCLALSTLLDGHRLSGLEGSAPAEVVRVFSGFWLFFFAVEAAAFSPALASDAAPRAHRCPFGHWVPAGVEFCPRCEWRVERD